MIDLNKIVEELSTLTVIQAADLAKMLEEKWGVSAAAPVASVAAPAALPETVVEKTEFDVYLTHSGDRKIEVIKEVKNITAMGLKETKELVDKAPVLIKKGANKADADDIKAKLEAAGAKVEIK